MVTLRYLPIVLFTWAIAFVQLASTVSAQLVRSDEEAVELPRAALVLKVRMGPIAKFEVGSPNGTKCFATCDVISTLKGEAGESIDVTFVVDGNGQRNPGVEKFESGCTYFALLDGAKPPYRLYVAMKGVPEVVAPKFGDKPGDHLLAELVALCDSQDTDARIKAIEQIGFMRDIRARDSIRVAVEDKNDDIVRAGLIAQYRMRIAPDAKRVMQLFNDRMLGVWYEESGTPLKDAKKNYTWREQKLDNQERSFMLRGVPDFDYATYVREGAKLDWVRKDDHTLYRFFGIPWKVQRPECVPEFITLLDDPNQKVRWWAVTCLLHTVNDLHESPSFEDYQNQEPQELEKWRTWWKEKGKEYMAQTARKPAN